MLKFKNGGVIWIDFIFANNNRSNRLLSKY